MSMIWFLLLIPLIAILFLLFNFKAKLAWWEYLLQFGIPTICIFVSNFLAIRAQTVDTEYWNSYLTNATYYEYWETWKEETCSREVCTGSGENETCHTEYYDCSYCDRNSEHWEASDNIGKTYSISRSHFEELCKVWSNRTFRDMRRSIRHSGLCGKDGDAYVTKFPGDFEQLQPVCVQYKYENRVQNSTSVFNFQLVDSADSARFRLFRYPHYESMGIFNYNPMLGWSDPKAIDRLRKWNAKLGASKQIHMMVCVFVGQPIEAAIHQERLWKGGNKNEFILCIGLDNQKQIDWAHVISWTDKEIVKKEVAQKVMDMPFDMAAIVDTLATNVRLKYKRKEFKDFAYIKVHPSNRAIAITAAITLLITIGLSIFSVLNPFDLDDPSGQGRRIYRWRRY